MFASIFFFEIKRALKSVSTYIYFLILTAVGFLVGLLMAGAFKSIKALTGGEKILANSPMLIDLMLTFVTGWVGPIIIVAVVGNAVLKDFRYNTHNILFSTPINKPSYLLGRFFAGIFLCLLIFIGPGIGFMLAYASPWVNPDKIGAFSMMAYVATYLHCVIPNLLFQGALFFAVSLITRDIFIIWLSLIIYWITLGIASAFVGSLDYEYMSALLDPMGEQAKALVTKYWSTYDKNHQIIRLTGPYFLNRVIWLSVGAIVYITGYSFFSFTSTPGRVSFRKKKVLESGGGKVPLFEKIAFGQNYLPKATRTFTTAAHFRMLWGLALNECKVVLRNAYFRIIRLFYMLFLFIVSFQIGKEIYDTPTYPVTYTVLEYLGGVFGIFITITTIMFSGEIIWRNRENRMDNIIDALPVPNWVFFVSKLLALMFLQGSLLVILIVCGMAAQAFKGYFHFEPTLYIETLFGLRFISMILFAVLCMFVHTLARNKYIGFFIIILFYIWNSFIASNVLKHNLFVFNSSPGYQYSDMNGFGHALFPYFIFKLYWGALGVLLATLTSALWTRGTGFSLKWRFQQSPGYARKRSLAVIAASAVVFIGCGSFIYYNTNIQNKHMSSYDWQELQVTYEKKYKKYEKLPQPKITDVKVNVDIFPSKRGLHASGYYVLQNKNAQPVSTIHVLMPSQIKVNQMTLSRSGKLSQYDSTFGYRIFSLAQPLAPGDTISLAFNVDMISKGFTHEFEGLSTPVYNGTFVHNTDFMPSIGYSREMEVSDNAERKKHGLAYRKTANPLNDSASYNTNVFTHDADFVSFETTMSTDADQTAIAPGYLQKDWTTNGRRYFSYKMDSKILNYYSFLSARYLVKKENYNGIALEIYYHKGHEYNLDRMLKGIKQSLAYYNTNFTPYQHRQVRILEFPRYSTFAQSFPNTIPFSEGIGFIARIDDDNKEDVDYVFYVTAHEVAHQWFAHQVTGADVEGSNILSETLAQYGAITVMEKQYGEERMHKFLHIEMDRYLTARSNESEKEKPLALADIDQQYIFYQKGSIVMTSLRRFLGEDSLNKGIRTFMQRYAMKAPPYPTTADFVACIRAVTPDSLQYVITDAFDKITIYDNSIKDAKTTQQGNTYTIDVTLDIKKYYADGDGKETAAQCNDYIEVAVYKDKNTVLQLTRYKLEDGINKLKIQTSAKPYKVVIDPRYMLMEKKPDDNELRLNANAAVAKK